MEAQPVMDLAAAMERFDGDQDLFLTLAEMFLERSPATLAAIQTALADKNLPMLAKEAHKLKGSAMEFCARPTVAAAAQLEESARQSALNEMAAIGEQVHAEVQRLTATLQVIIEKGFPA